MIDCQIPLIQFSVNEPQKKKKIAKVNKYCMDCGARLTYWAALSNPKAPNQHRVLTYSCVECTEISDIPHLIRVQRTETNDPIRIVNLEIKHAKKKLEVKVIPSSPKNRKKLAKKIKDEALRFG
jgi:hypothetical protein